MRRNRRWVTLFRIMALGALWMATMERGHALHTKTPPVLQVTVAPSQIVGGLRFSVGRGILVFQSDGDQLGNGNTVPQIFLFDHKVRVTGKKGLGIYQLTSGGQASAAPSAAKRGAALAFHSLDDLLGNGSTGRQVFASRKAQWKKGDLHLRQITKGSGESFEPIVSSSGRYVVFSSTGDLTQAGVGAGTHLYRVDLVQAERSGCSYPCGGGNPGIALVSSTEASRPAIDAKGGRVAFESRGDAAGTGCVNGASQIFLRDFRTNTVQQLTFGLADTRRPAFTADGKTLFFESAADLALTGNVRSNVFRLELAHVPPRLTQITFGTDGDTTEPAVGGTNNTVRLFFKSTASLTGHPSGIERLYAWSAATTILLTNGVPILSSPVSYLDFVAFVSSADFTGQNPSGMAHVFLVNAFPLTSIVPQPTGTPPGSPTPTASPTPLPDPCIGQPDATPCDDGNPCTTGEACASDACDGGTPITCPDDGNPCTADVCNTATGVCGAPQLCVCP